MPGGDRAFLAGLLSAVVPGAGHITLMRGCVPEMVSAFLDRGDADGLDGSCLTTLSRPPFFTNYTGPVGP